MLPPKERIMKKILKIITILVIVALLSPWLGFAARGAFPMNKPEFKELNYYQLLEWRWWDYQRLAREERLKNPTKPVKWLGKERPLDYGYSACFWTETTIKSVLFPYQSILFALAGLNGVLPSPTHSFPTEVTFSNVPAKMWEANETLIWHNLDVHGKNPDRECWSRNNIPSAEEFDETIAALKGRVAELDEKMAVYNSANTTQNP
jgi:hypothetical protein